MKKFLLLITLFTIINSIKAQEQSLSPKFKQDANYKKYIHKQFSNYKNSVFINVLEYPLNKCININLQRVISVKHWVQAGVVLGTGSGKLQSSDFFSGSGSMAGYTHRGTELYGKLLNRRYDIDSVYFKSGFGVDLGIYKAYSGLPLFNCLNIGLQTNYISCTNNYKFDDTRNPGTYLSSSRNSSRVLVAAMFSAKTSIVKNLGFEIAFGFGLSRISTGKSKNALDTYAYKSIIKPETPVRAGLYFSF